MYKPAVSSIACAHAIKVEGPGLKSRAGQIGAVSPTARHRCDVSSELCSPGATGRGDGPRHSSHASAKYREYNEDLILTLCTK